MTQVTTSLSSSQRFIEYFDEIAGKIQKEILDNQPYTIYSVPVQTTIFTTAAATILTAMKRHFSIPTNQSANSISLIGRNLSENFYTCDLNPLYKIFQNFGMTIRLAEEVPPPDPCPWTTSMEKIIYQMTYTTPNFTVTFKD